MQINAINAQTNYTNKNQKQNPNFKQMTYSIHGLYNKKSGAKEASKIFSVFKDPFFKDFFKKFDVNIQLHTDIDSYNKLKSTLYINVIDPTNSKLKKAWDNFRGIKNNYLLQYDAFDYGKDRLESTTDQIIERLTNSPAKEDNLSDRLKRIEKDINKKKADIDKKAKEKADARQTKKAKRNAETSARQYLQRTLKELQ